MPWALMHCLFWSLYASRPVCIYGSGLRFHGPPPYGMVPILGGRRGGKIVEISLDLSTIARLDTRPSPLDSQLSTLDLQPSTLN